MKQYVYKVFDNREEINRIVADEEFAEQYAHETGYTLVQKEEVRTPEPDDEFFHKFAEHERAEFLEAFMLAAGCIPESEVPHE